MTESSRPNPLHDVIALHEREDLDWEAISNLAPKLTRGWFELSRLPSDDRVEFTRDHWVAKMPIVSANDAQLEEHLIEFFAQVLDIGVFATQERPGIPYEVHMVYSLIDEVGFFQGGAPASDETISTLEEQFGNMILPPDYLAFLRIHNGFSKYTDTGIFSTTQLVRVYQHLQQLLYDELLVSPDGQVINPQDLIPFYEAHGLHCFQCFYNSWHPGEGIGNVFFSTHDHTISNFLDVENLKENLAFTTFYGWLIDYLEDLPNPHSH